MKNSKKLLALVLAVVFVFALSTTALAANSDVTEGSIEVLNPQDGQAYTAYKIFDVTYDGDNYAYTIPATSEWLADVQDYTEDGTHTDGVYTGNGLTLTPVKDAGGNVVSYNVSVTDAFSAPDFAEAMKEATDGKTGTTLTGTDTMKAEGLDLGYYLVSSTTGALANLTTTNPDVEIYDKNEVPEVDKEIVDDAPHCGLEESSEEGGHQHTAGCNLTEVAEKAIGDTVPFQLTTKVPDMTGYTKYFFVVKDTMSEGLTFNNDVDITLGGVPLTEGTHYTVEAITDDDTGATAIRIIFKNMLQYKDQVNAPIVITYSATLNENANIDSANTNSANIQYSNDPSVTPEYDPNDPPEDPDDPDDPKYTNDDPTGESTSDTTETYTTKLTVNKTDGTAPLTGAQFKLEGTATKKVIVSGDAFVPYVEPTGEGTVAPTAYWLLKDGTYTTTDPTTEGINVNAYASPTTARYMKVAKNTYDTTQTDVEAEAFVDASGKIVFTGLCEGTYTLTETVVPDGYNPIDPITVTVAFEETSKQFYIVEKATTDDDGKLVPDSLTMEMSVVNQTGTVLPTTGGMGTTIFYVAGSVLLIGAVILLITKKRMSVEG